jgi:hypothetical protein
MGRAAPPLVLCASSRKRADGDRAHDATFQATSLAALIKLIIATRAVAARK